VSNRRRLKVAGAEPAERCTSCGHRIGKNADALRLRTGQVICPRCRQYGDIPRLSCGHYSLPGSLVITDSDDYGNMQCAQCSPHVEQAGNMRLGLAGRDA